MVAVINITAMNSIILISSIAAAIIWALCYLLIVLIPGAYIFLIASFIAIVISMYMDERKRMAKQ